MQDRFAQRPDEDNCGLKKREESSGSRYSTCVSYPLTWELGVKKNVYGEVRAVSTS